MCVCHISHHALENVCAAQHRHLDHYGFACRYDQLLTLVHCVNGASLLVGGPGTAKTTVINQFLGKFNSEVSTELWFEERSTIKEQVPFVCTCEHHSTSCCFVLPYR